MKNKRSIQVALLSSILAIGVHSYLTKHFFDVKFGGASGPSFCNINEFLNCDAVAASSYSAFLGTPVALFGIASNLVLALLCVHTLLLPHISAALLGRLSRWISGLILGASVIMGMISATLMSHACIFCWGTYALSLITFLGLHFGTSKSPLFSSLFSDAEGLVKKHRGLLFVLTLPLWLPFSLNALIRDNLDLKKIDLIVKENITYWHSNPKQSFDLEKGLIRGPSETPKALTLVEFADFLCPHCKHASHSLHSFLSLHPDVRFIFKPFPLDGSCNKALSNNPGNGVRCTLAKIVFCMEKHYHQGWQAHDLIFEHQEQFARLSSSQEALDTFTKNAAAESSLISSDALLSCTNSPEIHELVLLTAQEGELAGIQGTPTIFANGRHLEGGQLIPVLNAAYEESRK